jgi:tetratricopeptide (TPR) repeat protein
MQPQVAKSGPKLVTALLVLQRSAMLLMCHSLAAQTSKPSAAPGTIPKACFENFKPSSPPSSAFSAIPDQSSASEDDSLGVAFEKQRRLSCASAAFRAALMVDPKFWNAHYHLGLLLLQESELQPAERELCASIALKPDLFQAKDALGLVFEREGHPNRAAKQFSSALALNPHSIISAMNLGELSLDLSRYQAAIYYLRLALASAPQGSLLSRIEADLGAAYSKSGDDVRAAQAFQRAVKASPGDANLHFNLANVYAHEQSYSLAADEYQNALMLAPDNLPALLSLAKALLIIHKAPQALGLALRYTQMKPTDPDGLDVLGQAYRETGKYPQAAAVLRHAAVLSPHDYNAHYNLGLVLEMMGQYADAIRELHQARRLRPDEAAPLYDLGLIMSKTHHPQAAKTYFDAFQQMKQMKDARERADVLNRQGIADYSKGYPGQAVKDYEESLKLNPLNPEVHYNLSLALARLGNKAEEKLELEKTLKLDPRFAKAHNQLGLCALREGRLAAAEQEFRKALSLQPNFAQAQDNLGVLMAREGQLGEALVLFEKATLNNPQYVQAYMNWGLTLAQQSHYRKAIGKLNQALAICGGCNETALLHKNLGLIEASKGDIPAALGELNSALKINPSDAEVQGLISKLHANQSRSQLSATPTPHP